MAYPDGVSKLGLVLNHVAQSFNAVRCFQVVPVCDSVVNSHGGLLEIVHALQRMLHIIAQYRNGVALSVIVSRIAQYP